MNNKEFFHRIKSFLSYLTVDNVLDGFDFYYYESAIDSCLKVETSITDDEKALAVSFVRDAFVNARTCKYLLKHPKSLVYDDSVYWQDFRNAVEKASLYIEQLEARYPECVAFSDKV